MILSLSQRYYEHYDLNRICDKKCRLIAVLNETSYRQYSNLLRKYFAEIYCVSSPEKSNLKMFGSKTKKAYEAQVSTKILTDWGVTKRC